VARYLLRKLAMAVPAIFVVSIAVFAMLRLAPGDPVSYVVPIFAPEEVRQQMIEKLGLHRPIYLQYLYFVAAVSRGDFGLSITTGQDALGLVLKRLPATLALGFTALVLSLVIAVPLGAIGAVYRNSLVDQACSLVVLLSMAVPPFWLGLMLVLVFGLHFGWLPVSGADSWHGIVLPAVTLAAGGMALSARMMRTAMLEVLRQEYVTTARAKGLHERAVLFRHAMRNALIPVISVLGIRLGTLIGGAVIVETVFAWPGIGWLMVESIVRRDYPVVQVVSLLLAVTVIAGNLVADILYALADPRIRYEDGGAP
jgi:peptide/nickel transport system permease protein